MGRTKRPQVALYLDQEKVDLLKKLADKSDQVTQQDLLREAVDDLLVKYRMLPKSKRKS